jgi:hypothetical protein
MRPDRQTDGHDVANSRFSHFANGALKFVFSDPTRFWKARVASDGAVLWPLRVHPNFCAKEYGFYETLGLGGCD